MKKVLLILILVLNSLSSYAQLEPECNNILGIATNQPSGSVNCTPFPLNPPIPAAGTPVTRCFSYQFLGPVNLGYLLVIGLCGPFPLYNTLSYTIYNSTCDTMVASGNILPFSPTNDTFIDELIPNQWYVICYNWIANCPQTDACPIIYTSLLPIELFEFYSDTYDNYNIINWSTQSETNNNFFVLEKSDDGINWKEIYRCKGAGNSSTINRYKFTDDNLYSSINYYRVKQIDFDGNYSYSGIILVNTTSTDKFLIFPNPSKDVINVYSLSYSSKSFLVTIEDIVGRVLFEQKMNTSNDGNNLKINVLNFKKGVYVVKIQNDDYTQEVYKFLKN